MSHIDLGRYAGTYGGYLPNPKPRFRIGVLFRWGSCWVGAHWSSHNRRWCVNPLPFVTVWVALPGGKAP